MEEIIIQVNGEIMINIDVWNPATRNCKNGKYLASIMMIQWLGVIKL